MWEEGLYVDIICTADDHPGIKFSWFSAAHDEESDKWKAASIVHKIAVVDRAVRLGSECFSVEL